MIGEAVRRRREELRLTGAQLAEKAGMAPSAVSQIETGKRTPSSSSVVKLAAALGVEVGDLFPKGQASLLDLAGERRQSKLPDVADMLLRFGEMLLLQWEAELPDRAEADDDEWLANIVVLWRMFGLVNYGVLDELGPGGIRDMGGWFGRYMDMNAAVHRINATIRAHSDSDMVPDELLLETLPKTA